MLLLGQSYRIFFATEYHKQRQRSLGKETAPTVDQMQWNKARYWAILMANVSFMVLNLLLRYFLFIFPKKRLSFAFNFIVSSASIYFMALENEQAYQRKKESTNNG